MKKIFSILLLMPLIAICQTYTYQSTGAANYHTQYKGGIGADKTFKLPTGVRSTSYSFDKKGLLQINSITNSLEFNNGLEWKTVLDSIKGTQLFKPLSYTPTYNELTGKPDLSVYYLSSNPNGYISSVPAQTWGSITGKPLFSTVALTGSYNDLSNLPPAQSFSGLTGKPTTLSGYGITDAYPLGSNPAGYLTSFTESDPNVPAYSKSLTAFSVIKNATDPLYKSNSYIPSSVEITTALGLTPINQSGARSAISITNNGNSGNATYNNATGVINIPNYSSSIYTGSASVTSNGNAVFYLTNDGTSSGNALFTNVNFAVPFVNDSTINYTYSWSYNSTTKALTVNTKASAGVNVAALGLTLLGVPTNVANGTAINVLVKGI